MATKSCISRQCWNHPSFFLFLLSIVLLLGSFFTKVDPGPMPYCIGEGAWAAAGEGTGGGTLEAATVMVVGGKAGGATTADTALAGSYGYDFPVVHCDLKPANVLLDADMVAHVSDFGISKILAENKSTAQTKTLGTVGYIAPEYGSEGTVSAAGDVYSYGIMLMELLTRRKPTNELFSDNLSLRQWVKAAFPNSLMEVVDANLFRELNSRHDACLLSLVELSLHCSKEAPEERINMKDAVVRLNKIKERFLETKET